MLNKCIFMGRMAADPELRRTNNGTACCTFRLAVERDYKAADGQKATDWLNFVAWRGTAEFVSKYFVKGQNIAVEAQATVRSWTTDAGEKRSVVEFVAQNVYFAGSKGAGNAADKQSGVAPAYTEPRNDFAEIGEEDGELPF